MSGRMSSRAMSGFELLRPATVEEALAALRPSAAGPVGVLAGGTDLLPDLDVGRSSPKTVVSLRRLPWRTHAWEGDGLRIGSTEPLRTLELDAGVANGFPALHQAIAAVGGPALRRQASVGGNLGRAAPASDLLPVLLVLDAQVDLVREGGGRTVPVDEFLQASRRTDLAAGELIRSVYLPERRPSAYLWQRVRPANDISQVAVAVAYSPSQGSWRVALGGIPPRAILVPEAATELGAGAPSREGVERASARLAAHSALVSDRRATEEYRRGLVGTLLGRAAEAAFAAYGGPP